MENLPHSYSTLLFSLLFVIAICLRGQLYLVDVCAVAAVFVHVLKGKK